MQTRSPASFRKDLPKTEICRKISSTFVNSEVIKRAFPEQGKPVFRILPLNRDSKRSAFTGVHANPEASTLV